MHSYKFTETELKALIKILVILADTREQVNMHVVSTFTKQGLTVRSRALNAGDYSVMLPSKPDLGILRDTWLDSLIWVERKASLEELAGNLAQGRERFENEMLRSNGAEKHLVVEDGSWERIINGDYVSGLKPKSFYNSLLSFKNKYGLHIHFVPKSLAGFHIPSILTTFVKNYLKGVHKCE